jgi:hypothetical protein
MEHLAFVAAMDGVQVQFKDLCTPCLKTVKNHLEQIGKKIDGLSPDRKPTDSPPKGEDKEEEPPTTGLPHLNPPIALHRSK